MHFDCVRQSCDGSAARDYQSCETFGLLRRTWSLAIARLPAVAFLVVVHGTVLAALFATGRLVRRKRNRAHHCNQNREEDFAVVFHGISFVPRAGGASKNRTYS